MNNKENPIYNAKRCVLGNYVLNKNSRIETEPHKTTIFAISMPSICHKCLFHKDIRQIAYSVINHWCIELGKCAVIGGFGRVGI